VNRSFELSIKTGVAAQLMFAAYCLLVF